MLTLSDIRVRLYFIWAWLVDIWEFIVLLTLGFHPARRLLTISRSSDETCETITTCLFMYRRRQHGESLSQIQDMLNSCDAVNIAQTTTEDGYNILQLAVCNDDVEFTRYLLQQKKINPNISKCSLPLHIAITRQNPEMVSLLIENKARPQQTGGMCYPEPHIPYYSSHSKFFFVSPSMVCGGCSKDAYQRAVDLDDVSLLEPLLQKKNSSILTTMLLNYACDQNAVSCIRHLCEVWKANVNDTDNRGRNSLMHSIHLDITDIEYLVSKGADVNLSSYQGQTLLHMLYHNTDRIPNDVYKKTKYLLALGADNIINEVDVFRNTCLNYLCRQYKAHVKDRLIEAELRHCLGALLSHNADTSLPDSDSNLPLLLLLMNTTEQTDGNDSINLPSPDNLYKLLKYFCISVPTAICKEIDKENQTAMFYLLQAALDLEDLRYLNCITLLKEHGADINHLALTSCSSPGKTIRADMIKIKSLLTIVKERAVHIELDLVKPYASLTQIQEGKLLVTDCLKFLFNLGLDPNAGHIECRSQEQCESINALTGFTRLVNRHLSNIQMELLESWIRLILQYGGDPDREPYRLEPQICTSQSSIFLRKDTALPVRHCVIELMAQPILNESLARIVRLFILTMSYDVLLPALNSLHMNGMMYSTSTTEAEEVSSMMFLRNITMEPLPLTLLSKRIIHQNLKGKRRRNISTLGLPNSMAKELVQMT